ncbi:hypothetical protein [Faecalibacterium prausnitzii]|uniref:Uncharacterized protein n=1 Tax=Faecalibacterium prausnitzii M21/2 TaxID=411485 RepID=A8S9Q5_9FIRM|nr:hypothetical protein [Faecalibacterium prausnitzii]EDP22079.1 hypothetical protein FAEPRAM212_01113 [Faecalibacterium prausnitzii M21/2]
MSDLNRAVAKQPKRKNEMDFPEKGCLSHFLLYSETAINQIQQGRYVHYCAISDYRPRRTDAHQLMAKTTGRWVSYYKKK